MKKILKIGQYYLVFALILALVNRERVGEVIENLNSGDGIFIGTFKFIGQYFANADTWNIIILLISLSFILILFSITSLAYDKLFDYLSTKHKFFLITKKEWFGWIRTIMVGCTILAITVIFSNALVIIQGKKASYDTVAEIKEAKPVLILGTSKMLSSGNGENLYYTYRIEAALELWKAGKARYFIISGDKSGDGEDDYNEVRDMKNDLIAGGVPESAIKLDGSGYRTLDSILRIRALFKVDDMIIVSQEFHTQRALFLAWFYGVEAKAYNAKGTATSAMLQRETFGKVKMLLDLYAFNMQPKVSTHDDYREKFEVKSDAHVILLILVLITVAMSFWMVINLMEKNSKGIYKKLVITSSALIGAILMMVTLYNTTEILDDFVKVVSETTGIAKEAVKKKEDRKEHVKQLETEIQEIEKEETEKFDSIYTNYQAEAELAADSIDAVMVASLITSDQNTKEEVFASLMLSDDDDDVVEETKEIPLEEIVHDKNDPFAGLNVGGSDEEGVSNESSNTESATTSGTAKFSIRGTQLVENNTMIRLRVLEPIAGTNLAINSMVEGQAFIVQDRLNISLNISDNLKGTVYDEFGDKGIALSRFDLSRDRYVLSDGFKMKVNYK